MKIAHLWVFDSTAFVNNELFDIQAYLRGGGVVQRRSFDSQGGLISTEVKAMRWIF